jgi:hypothetical protein
VRSGRLAMDASPSLRQNRAERKASLRVHSEGRRASPDLPRLQCGECRTQDG